MGTRTLSVAAILVSIPVQQANTQAFHFKLVHQLVPDTRHDEHACQAQDSQRTMIVNKYLIEAKR
jgi:hypothetical protein